MTHGPWLVNVAESVAVDELGVAEVEHARQQDERGDGREAEAEEQAEQDGAVLFAVGKPARVVVPLRAEETRAALFRRRVRCAAEEAEQRVEQRESAAELEGERDEGLDEEVLGEEAAEHGQRAGDGVGG